jgi:Amt family ammonium transporter
MWVLIAAALVFFMQAGFAMVETGLTRAKNAGNIVMKNLMDFAIGSILFWFVGFGIMFGSAGSYFGGFDFFIQGNYDSSLPTAAFVIFQTVFCATAATIVSGAMAERTKFISYCIYSLILSAVIYPISGHWVWGGGWLYEMGFHDFAGSTVVHMVGGAAALVGAIILGPRTGKYTKSGKVNAIPGHSITLAALGVFILWFGWFGFNGGSTVSFTGDEAIVSASSIFVTTNMAAATATIVVMIITWIIYKKPDVSMTLNGSLAGLVAITAGCDVVSPVGAALIGVCAGIIVVASITVIDKLFKIDDPVGAIGVHGICGALGTILVGLFAVDGGLLYGGSSNLLRTQFIGVGAVLIWVIITMSIVFLVIKHTIGLRVSPQEEIEGLDIHEHGLVNGYADFMPSTNYLGMIDSSMMGVSAAENRTVPIPATATSINNLVNTPTPVAYQSKVVSTNKLTKVTILMNHTKFEELKYAMNQIGVTGMTVTQVLGCGIQKGKNEFYRGVPMSMNLLPKIQVDIVVSKVNPDEVIATAKKILASGSIGDGKIFVYDVENVVKIRTGEEGYSALQDESDLELL